MVKRLIRTKALRPSLAKDVFENNSYRGVNVPQAWACTSKGAGNGNCVSQLKADGKRVMLKDVMGYKNPDVVARIAKELKCSMWKARRVFKDVKRFLWMCTRQNGVDMIPTPTIDEGWHAFVLFTEDYAKFCQTYFGQFIHHTPHRVNEPQLTRTALIPSINAMFQTFGGMPSSNWHFVPSMSPMLT